MAKNAPDQFKPWQKKYFSQFWPWLNYLLPRENCTLAMGRIDEVHLLP